MLTRTAAVFTLALMLVLPTAAQDTTPTDIPTEVPPPTLIPTDPPPPPPTFTEIPTSTFTPTAVPTETRMDTPTAAATETATLEATQTAIPTTTLVETPSATTTSTASSPTVTPSATPSATPANANRPAFSILSNNVYYRYASDLTQLLTHVNEANTNPGDQYVIWLTSATYTISAPPIGLDYLIITGGNIVIAPQPPLTSAKFLNATTFNFRLFYNISGRQLLLRNLEIENFGTLSNKGGGVINEGTLRVYDTVFRDNIGQDGGAIANLNTATIWNSTFDSNTAAGGGGGVSNESIGTLTIQCSTFDGNSASYGGGISGYAGNTITVHKSNFIFNTSQQFSPSSQAIYNNPSHSAIDATGNWWASSDGPANPSGGSGDSITSNVTYIPFETAGAIDIHNATLCPEPFDVLIPAETVLPTATPTFSFATNTPPPAPTATPTLSPSDLQTIFPVPMGVANPRLSDGNADSHLSTPKPQLCSRDIGDYDLPGVSRPLIASAVGSIIIVDQKTQVSVGDNGGLGNFIAVRLPFNTLPIEIQNLLTQTYPNIAAGHAAAVTEQNIDYLHLGYGHLDSISVVLDQSVAKATPVVGMSGITGLEAVSPAPGIHLDLSIYYVSNTGIFKPDPNTLTTIDWYDRYFNIFINTDGRYGIIQAIDPLVVWPILEQGFTGTIIRTC